MTNEQKAIVTWTQEYREHQFKDCCPSQQAFYQRGFVEGADWKDHQLKEYLEKKLGRYAGGELVYAGVFINDIINELFGGE